MDPNTALFTLSAIFQGMCALIALTLIGTTIFYQMTTKISTVPMGGNRVLPFAEKATLPITIFFLCITLFLIIGTATAILAVYYMPLVGDGLV